MTQLKIDNNPFAKGFRENGQLRVKKRQLGDISPGMSDDDPPLGVTHDSSLTPSLAFNRRQEKVSAEQRVQLPFILECHR